jgi:hypothetical protein
MGRMFASGPGSHSAFTNTNALESAANQLKGCRSSQMHWFMHARRGVLLFTSRFNSPIAAAAHDMRRRFRCTFNAPPLQVELAIASSAPVRLAHRSSTRKSETTGALRRTDGLQATIRRNTSVERRSRVPYVNEDLFWLHRRRRSVKFRDGKESCVSGVNYFFARIASPGNVTEVVAVAVWVDSEGVHLL